MSVATRKVLGLASIVLAFVSFGCGDDDDDTGATGGATASGGSTSSGGGDTGGAGGAGTATASGGTAATTETGGEAGVGTAPAEAGNGGSEVAGAPEEVLFDFAEAAQIAAFELLDYTPGDDYINWYEHATFTHSMDPGVGGDPGMAKLEVAFDAFKQLVDIQTVFEGDGKDWTGRTARARIWVESGLVDSDWSGGTKLFVKAGAQWSYANGPWVNLPPAEFGQWVDVEIDLDQPDFADECTDDESDDLPACDSADYTEKLFTPAEILAIGIQLCTGGGNPDDPELPPPTATVAYLDHFTVE